MAANAAAIQLKQPRFSSTVMARFFGKQAVRSGVLWGLAFGLVTYASAVGFSQLGKTVAERNHILAPLASNVGLKVILGEPHNITQVGGFVDWRVTGIVSIVVSVWAIMTTTRMFRGEETAGRWELFLSGPLTPKRAALHTLAGLCAGVCAMYAALLALTLVSGASHEVGFSFAQSASYAGVLVSSAVVFIGVGALASQLMPIRARAAALAAGVFGVCFILHGVANIAGSVHWVLYLTPLGWIELIRPLGGEPNLLWFVPLFLLAAVCASVAVYMAGHRDLYASTFVDKDSSKPHIRLLNSPLGAAVRLNRTASAIWIAAAGGLAFLYGSFTKAAVDIVSSNGLVQRFGGQLFHAQQLQGAKTYAGFIFFIMMTLIMVYAATGVSKIREDEAQGYVDNLLVRNVGRMRWLSGRILIVAAVIVLAGLAVATGMWLGQATGHAGLSWGDMLLGGANAMAPAMLLLGIGVFVFGWLPRATAVVCYGAVALSFLVQMLGSAVHLNHWIVDLSILSHVALVPAQTANWHVVAVYIALGASLLVGGALRFRLRDVTTE